MEENSQEIMLNSLRNAGVPIPSGVSTIRHLTPDTLFLLCSKSLRLMDPTLSFPSTLPEDSVAHRVRICSDLTSAFKRLGFVGDISFLKFLYPSEEDLYKLVRFVASRLSVSSDARKASGEKEADEEYDSQFKRSNLPAEAAESASVRSVKSSEDRVIASGQSSKVTSLITVGAEQQTAEKVEVAIHKPGQENLSVSTIECSHNYKQKEESLEENLDERELSTDLAVKKSELRRLEEEYDLLKTTVETAFDNEHPIDFYIQQLNSVVESRKDALAKLESHWSDLKVPLEEKRRSLEDVLCSRKPEFQEKFQKRIETEQEISSVLAETEKREEELSALREDLNTQPRLASRESFVQRIKEITKNSRKLDGDIDRILKDSRELQLESNSNQERLDRTYAVVKETISREARKDPVGQQAYRILTGIHQAFAQTAETILVSDRTRREVADYEAKHAKIASRSLNIDKLRSDLDAIRSENDILQQQLQNH